MLLWCKLGTTITVTRKGKYHNEIGAIISISALMKTGMVRFDLQFELQDENGG